jgi:hypothetical protein
VTEPTPFDTAYFASLIDFTIRAHDKYATQPRKRFRKWDGHTPYSIHPLWCATTILTETALPADIRYQGALALLLHDVLEDTEAPLPPSLPAGVEDLVQEMTFDSYEDEVERVWGRSELCHLLKLYDKTSNLLDANWRTNKREAYINYTGQLCQNAETRWGTLNITKIARAVTS